MKIFSNISIDSACGFFPSGWKNFLFDLHISDDIFDNYRTNWPEPDTEYNTASRALDTALTKVLYMQSSRRISFKTLKRILLESGSSRTAVLFAHGLSKDGIWNYIDGENRKLVQSWIDEFIGNTYGALVICSCNGYHLKPVVRKIPIFYPTEMLSPVGTYTELLMPK
jgi:hypothetical protein